MSLDKYKMKSLSDKHAEKAEKKEEKKEVKTKKK